MRAESRIRDLSKTDEELANELAAKEKAVADSTETQDRSRYQFLKPFAAKNFYGIQGSKKAYRAEFEKLRARFDPSPAPLTASLRAKYAERNA